MNTLVIASNNIGKIAEIKRIFGGVYDDIVSMREAGVDADIVEDGETFLDNAVKKAKTICELCGLPCLADDSGLCVDALSGAPGVYSARYSGSGDSANMDKLLAEMRGAADRAARFECVVALVYPDGRVLRARGCCYGKIAHQKSGTQGFGYDPVFISDDYGRTFGEVSAEQKDAVSHRKKALENLKRIIPVES